MRKLNPSFVAIGLASAALFASLGGPAWALGLINGSQIKNGSITGAKLKNGSVTSRKIGAGQVKTANLGLGAVTGSRVAPGSLTAADVAPNTFLPANGTAANSTELGGVPATGFVHGGDSVIQNRVEINVGTTGQFLLDTGLGEVDGSCLAGDKPEVSFTAEAQPLDLIEWGTTFPSAADINPLHGMLIGDTYTEPDSSALQTVDFQVAQTGVSNPSRVATIWTTGDASGGTACIFTAQAVTTGV